MRGLDPRIHHLRKRPSFQDGLPGQAHGCPARIVLHAAFSKVRQARAVRRRWAARVADGSKSNVAWRGVGPGGDGFWRSPAIGRRCMRLAWINLAKASGLLTILLASCASRSRTKAIRATVI